MWTLELIAANVVFALGGRWFARRRDIREQMLLYQRYRTLVDIETRRQETIVGVIGGNSYQGVQVISVGLLGVDIDTFLYHGRLTEVSYRDITKLEEASISGPV